MLVWDGHFGADAKEMRMLLPDLYPSSSTPYDQNEDFEARTLGEAIVSAHQPAHHIHQPALGSNNNKINKLPPLLIEVRTVVSQVHTVDVWFNFYPCVVFEFGIYCST